MWLIVFIGNGFPWQETFFICGQGTNACILPVAYHQRFVADKQIAEFVFIGLQLVKCGPDISIGINGAFQLNHRNWQAVDIANHIRAPHLLCALNGNLVHDHKAVIGWMVKIHQQRFIVNDFLFTLVLNGHTVEQQMVKCFVADDQIRALRMGDTQYHLFEHGNREMGIDGL